MSKPSSAELVAKYVPDYTIYETIYKNLHSSPELSFCEHETAALVASTLAKISPDIEIKTGIGGTGLVGVLRNGKGKTVLLRADMDGLPVKEETGLDYASKKEMADIDGVVHPTMHACGHDMHVSALLAAADIIVQSRAHWSGTVLFLFQPAEENVRGAKAMVADGLWAKYDLPLPDVLLGQHVVPGPSGHVMVRSGAAMAGIDALVVTVYGNSCHGSMPQFGIDAVLLASHIVVRLQSIVSRGIPPDEVGVVTVGALHAGAVDNVIANKAELKINVRSASAKWRKYMVDRLRAIIKAECVASDSPREPEFVVTKEAPVLVNEAATTALVSKHLGAFFGDKMVPHPMVPGSEDFSFLADAIDKPYCFWLFGGTDPEEYSRRSAEGTLDGAPQNHQSTFAPVIQPTLTTGAQAFATALWGVLE